MACLVRHLNICSTNEASPQGPTRANGMPGPPDLSGRLPARQQLLPLGGLADFAPARDVQQLTGVLPGNVRSGARPLVRLGLMDDSGSHRVEVHIALEGPTKTVTQNMPKRLFGAPRRSRPDLAERTVESQSASQSAAHGNRRRLPTSRHVADLPVLGTQDEGVARYAPTLARGRFCDRWRGCAVSCPYFRTASVARPWGQRGTF
jgi:hypothetical protein